MNFGLARLIILIAFAMLLMSCASSPGEKACHTIVNETAKIEITDAASYQRFVQEWERVYRLTEGAEPEIRDAVGRVLDRLSEGSLVVEYFGDLPEAALTPIVDALWGVSYACRNAGYITLKETPMP